MRIRIRYGGGKGERETRQTMRGMHACRRETTYWGGRTLGPHAGRAAAVAAAAAETVVAAAAGWRGCPGPAACRSSVSSPVLGLQGEPGEPPTAQAPRTNSSWGGALPPEGRQRLLLREWERPLTTEPGWCWAPLLTAPRAFRWWSC